MENNLSNKVNFFALYYMQKVMNYYGYLHQIDFLLNNHWIKESHLELKSLSDISDEDALSLGRISNNYPGSLYVDNLKYCKELVRRYINRPSLMDYESVDFLRSKGYALPYMNLSIDKLIEFGWMKVKNNR